MIVTQFIINIYFNLKTSNCYDNINTDLLYAGITINLEAFALEFQKNVEDIFPRYHMHSDVYNNLQPHNSDITKRRHKMS